MDLSPGTVIVPRRGADAEIEREVAMMGGFDSGPLLWQGRPPYVGAAACRAHETKFSGASKADGKA